MIPASDHQTVAAFLFIISCAFLQKRIRQRQLLQQVSTNS